MSLSCWKSSKSGCQARSCFAVPSCISNFMVIIYLSRTLIFTPINSTNGMLITLNAFRWTRGFYFPIKEVFHVPSFTCVYNLLKNTFAKGPSCFHLWVPKDRRYHETRIIFSAERNSLNLYKILLINLSA